MIYLLTTFRFFSSILILVTSSDGYKPHFAEFCQWEAFYTSSKRECNNKCLSAKGFRHSISNELICFEGKSIAKPILIVRQSGLEIYNCECADRSSPDYVRCDPKKSYENFKSLQCYDTCAKYTAYKFRRNNKTEAFCDESFKVKEFILDYLPSRVHSNTNYSKDRKLVYNYSCRCGLHLRQLMEKGENPFGSKQIEISENNDEFLLKCPIKSIPLPNSVPRDFFCSEKCSSHMGYITRNNELLCFNRINSAVDISLYNEPCQCGHIKAYKTKKTNQRLHCVPNLILPSIKYSHVCKSECATKIVLRKLEPRTKNLDVIWCGEISNPGDIFMSMDWAISEKVEKGSSSFVHCTCGLKTKSKETLLSSITQGKSPQLIADFSDVSSTDEEVAFNFNGKVYVKRRTGYKRMKDYREALSYTCTMEPAIHTKKDLCISSCLDAKAHFANSISLSELICYHQEKITEKISFSDEMCECGIWLKKDTSLLCNPRIIVPASTEEQCFDICSNMLAYIFDMFPAPTIIRCLEKDYNPRRVFERLDAKIGRSVFGSNQRGHKTVRYTCECGIRSPIRNDTNLITDLSRAGPSLTDFEEDRISNDDVFGHNILEDNYFTESLKYPPEFRFPEIQSIDTYNENIDPLSIPTNIDFNLPRINDNDPSHLSSRAEVDPVALGSESIEAYLMNDEYDIPAEDSNIPLAIDQYFTELCGESRSSLQAHEFRTSTFKNANTSHTAVLEFESIEAYLVNDEYNEHILTVEDSSISSTLDKDITKSYGKFQSSLQTREFCNNSTFRIKNTNPSRAVFAQDIPNENNDISNEVFSNSLSTTNIFIFKSSVPSEYEAIEAILTNDNLSLPVGDHIPPSNSYYNQEIRNFKTSVYSCVQILNEELFREGSSLDIVSTNEVGMSDFTSVRESQSRTKPLLKRLRKG